MGGVEGGSGSKFFSPETRFFWCFKAIWGLFGQKNFFRFGPPEKIFGQKVASEGGVSLFLAAKSAGSRQPRGVWGTGAHRWIAHRKGFKKGLRTFFGLRRGCRATGPFWYIGVPGPENG